jgi:leucyl aminopeptidase
VVPENLRESFQKDEEATHTEGSAKTVFLSLKKAKSTSISSNCSLKIDADLGDTEHHNYLGFVSEFLGSAYKFDRKEKPSTPHVITILEASPKIHRAVNLAIAKNRAREWANGRGDVEGVPKYFKGLAEAFCKENGLEITTFTGDELVKEGFRLMHAVGRGSSNEPVFVNMAYRGNPDSNNWISFVGKGVCFDTGGYNLKPSTPTSTQPLASRTCFWTNTEPAVSSLLSALSSSNNFQST